MNSNDFVSINQMISDTTDVVGDEAFTNGLSEGWYKSTIQKALHFL